jgi:hypothetical protein
MITFTVSPDELPYDAAYRAHTGTSFVPERRAKDCQAEFASHVQALFDSCLPSAETEAQQTVLLEEMVRYRDGYKVKVLAHLGAQSRCMSTMITGGSNFPVRRNDKANTAEHRRLEELLAWDTRARRAVFHAVLAARTSEQVCDAEWADLKSYIDHRAISANIAGKIERLAVHGKHVLVQQALDYIKAHRTLYGDLQKSSPRQLTQKQAPTLTMETVIEKDGVEVILHHGIDRVQIYFPGKPDAATMAKLKSSGWHWSPSQGAWQRQLTGNALASAKAIMSALTPSA